MRSEVYYAILSSLALLYFFSSSRKVILLLAISIWTIVYLLMENNGPKLIQYGFMIGNLFITIILSVLLVSFNEDKNRYNYRDVGFIKLATVFLYFVLFGIFVILADNIGERVFDNFLTTKSNNLYSDVSLRGLSFFTLMISGFFVFLFFDLTQKKHHD